MPGAGNGVHITLEQALLGCTIPTPLRMALGAPALVHCVVSLGSGALEISTATPGERHLAHLRASASRTAAPAQLPAAAALGSQLRAQPHALAVHAAAAAAATHAAWLPTATATVALEAAAHVSGFLAHPAATDCMLHIGAALAAQATPQETRVPTAIGAFCPRRDLAAAQGAWASAEVTEQLPNGSAASSYRLAAAGSADPSLVHLADLQAKAVRLASMGVKSASLPVKEHMQPRMLYRLAWQASMPAGSHTSQPKLEPNGRHAWQQAAAKQHIISSKRVSAHTGGYCLADMALLQQTLAQEGTTAAAGLALLTSGAQQQQESICGPSSCNAQSSAAAAAWGMVRVAATERPDLAWAAIDVQLVQAAHRADAWPQADAFGAACTSGTASTPRIMAEQRRAVQDPDALVAPSGQAIITGGLGGSFPS